MHENHNNNKNGLGYTKAKTPFNSHRKYVDILTIVSALTVEIMDFKETCPSKIQACLKHVAYVEREKIVKPGPSQKVNKLPRWTEKNFFHLLKERTQDSLGS